MEKRKPTYDLASFQAAAGKPGKLAVTTTAARTAFALGFDRAGQLYVKFTAGVLTEFVLLSFKERDNG